MSAQPSSSFTDFQKAVAAGWQDSEAAKRYATAENATRPFCKILVDKSGLAQIQGDVHVLDLATGTGAAVQELYDAMPKDKWALLNVLGADVSPAMLEYLKNRGEESGWKGLETCVVDGNVSFLFFSSTAASSSSLMYTLYNPNLTRNRTSTSQIQRTPTSSSPSPSSSCPTFSQNSTPCSNQAASSA